MFDSIKGVATTYEPYKYIMQDVGNIYIGAKFSYRELIDNENLNFKMKAIIKQYILKESDMENTLESQLFYLEKNNFVYETLSQLKIKVKAQVLEQKKALFGKTKSVYAEKVFTLDELTDINLAKKKGMGMVITEMTISKLSLMSFTV